MSNSKAYKDYKIGKNEYRELFYFCRQYPEKKALLNACYGVKTPFNNGEAHGSGISNPTESQAIKAEKLGEDVKIMEQAANAAVGDALAKFILLNVAYNDMPYEKLGRIPMGRQQFYEARRRFFHVLKVLKMG